MRRAAFLPLVLTLAGTALAGPNIEIPLPNDLQSKISIKSCFSVLPFFGYAPVSVDISNDSLRPQSWTFQFESPAYAYMPANSMSSEMTVDVANQSTRSFKMLVPLAPGTERYLSRLGVSVAGNHFSGSGTQQFPPVQRSGKSISAFVAISDPLATKSLSQIEKTLSVAGVDLAAARFDSVNLSDDWRAYVGVTALWITSQEFDALSALQRDALHDWILRGGMLYVAGRSDAGPQFRSTGFGGVTLLPDQTLGVEETAATVHGFDRLSIEHQLTESYGAGWKAAEKVGSIHLNAPLLITFIVVFALVVGPLNLFVFARQGRRHRLFWTTPLISIAASIFLLVIIVLQDGFGGIGSRGALIFVDPVAKRSAILQEQVARTGVLLGSSFRTSDPSFIAPIVLGSPPSAPKKKYRNLDTDYAGEWFVSRTVQPHWVESVAPSRSGVTLVNAAAVRDAHAAPIVVSNIESVLEELWFRDENGNDWHARNVATGARSTLQGGEKLPDLLPADAGARLQSMWKQVREKPGYFYALTHQGNHLVPTLPSIRWTNSWALFIGPPATTLSQ